MTDIGELGSIYVLPHLQGLGIGSALIQAMVNELNDRGIDHFSLDSGYKEAQCRWIRKFGEPYLVAKDYWGPGKDHMIWLCQVKDFVKTFSGKPQSGFPYIYLKN